MTGAGDAGQGPSEPDERRVSLAGLQELIDRIPAPVLVVDLSVHRLCLVNEAAAAQFGATWPVPEELFERDLAEGVGEAEAQRMEEALSALERRVIHSYEGDRRYRDLRGDPVHAHHSVSRVDLCDAPPVALAVVRPQENRDRTGDMELGEAAPTLATLGHDWRFEDIGPQAESNLGISPAELAGTPLLAAVHPDDATEILVAVARSLEDGPMSTTVHFRTGDEWRALEVTVGPVCHHRPPQLAMLLCPSRRAPIEQTDEQARLHALERHLRRIARELEAAGVGVFPPFHIQANPMPSLSLQQREVVTRLLRGERIGQIAKNMHLSDSTVRNHLSAIYRKFEVHSQAELIARLTGRLVEPGDM